MVSFEAQKFLRLMNSNLSIFSFVTYAFSIMSKKLLPNIELWMEEEMATHSSTLA